MVKQAHIVLATKGGDCKTTTANILAQYFQSLDLKPFVIDTDPENKGISQYQGLHAVHYPVDPNLSDKEKTGIMSDLIRKMINDPALYVVDNGSASARPMAKFLIKDQAIKVFATVGMTPVAHLPIATGEFQNDTAQRALEFASELKKLDVPTIVWLFDKEGRWQVYDDGDPRRSFEEMPFFKELKATTDGFIHIPEFLSVVGEIIRKVNAKRLTLAEAVKNPQEADLDALDMVSVNTAMASIPQWVGEALKPFVSKSTEGSDEQG